MTVLPPAAGAGHQGQLEKLARRGTASVVGAGLGAIFGVLLVVIVTHGFSAAVAGTLFAATAAFLILESVALLGTDTGLVRWLPAQLASGRAADLHRTLVVSAVPVLALSLGVAVVLYAAAPDLAPHLVGADAAPTMSLMLRALALALPVAALYDGARGEHRPPRAPGSGRAGGLPHRGWGAGARSGLVAALRGGPGTGRRLVAQAVRRKDHAGGAAHAVAHTGA